MAKKVMLPPNHEIIGGHRSSCYGSNKHSSGPHLAGSRSPNKSLLSQSRLKAATAQLPESGSSPLKTWMMYNDVDMSKSMCMYNIYMCIYICIHMYAYIYIYIYKSVYSNCDEYIHVYT